jgi:hypothetical protein
MADRKPVKELPRVSAIPAIGGAVGRLRVVYYLASTARQRSGVPIALPVISRGPAKEEHNR